MSRFRTSPNFLGFSAVTGDPRDDYHPVILSVGDWSKWFWRVKKWAYSASGTSFSPTPGAGVGMFGTTGAATDELDLVVKPLEVVATYQSFWSTDETIEETGGGPKTSQLFFYLNSAQYDDNDPTSQISQLRWSDTTDMAMTLIVRVVSSVDGVGGSELSSIYSEGVAYAAATGNPLVTRSVTIDPTGVNLSLPLYGYDLIGLTMTWGPSEYWSYDGIYNTSTGAVNPGESVYSNSYIA